jgi:hypothetical protein
MAEFILLNLSIKTFISEVTSASGQEISFVTWEALIIESLLLRIYSANLIVMTTKYSAVICLCVHKY